MKQTFVHGYALLVGVGVSSYPAWSLPVTVKDAKALYAILVDPSLCCYPTEHVRLLCNEGATRDAIVDGLRWLCAQAASDAEATVVIYYSGHGWIDQATGEYYLIPHNVKPFDIPASALAATIFIDALRKIAARRLLVFIDSCHAEGMATAKGKGTNDEDLPAGFKRTALPEHLVSDLKQGEGRAVFTSSRGKQLSWIRPDRTMSIYTYHLIEALQGAGNHPGDTVVRLSNLMNYLSRTVPLTARKLCQAEQTPFFDTATEDFPVAMLRGGKGLPSEEWEAIQREISEQIHKIDIDQRSGVYFGQGPVYIGGDVVGGNQSKGGS